MIVDLFAGGGGASLAIQRAFGRSPDLAVNHDEHAIRMHAANHPETHHEEASVWEVRPKQACGGREVDLLWLSPDCRHFSRAKGAALVSPKVRTLARVAIPWARTVRPRLICLENVQEFTTWGPLVDGRPDPRRSGLYFRRWVRDLEREGYAVDWRILNAADFGAPTSRKRLFLVARADGQAPVWPEPTHGPGRSKPWRTAAECIDWSIPVPSIFDRSKPLAEMTQRRIAAGLVRFVLEGKPFLISIDNRSSGLSPVWDLERPLTTVMTENRHALVAPFVSKFFGTSIAGQSIEEPLSTVTSQGGHHAICMAWVAKHYGGVVGQQVEMPLGTVTSVDHHSLCVARTAPDGIPFGVAAGYGDREGHGSRLMDLGKPLGTVVAGGIQHAIGMARPGEETPDHLVAWITKYYGTGGAGSDLQLPLPTITTVDRMGLVVARLRELRIVDIGMRMLQPRELARAQGFPDSYLLPGTKTQQVHRIGNSVSPYPAEAVLRMNNPFELSRVAA